MKPLYVVAMAVGVAGILFFAYLVQDKEQSNKPVEMYTENVYENALPKTKLTDEQTDQDISLDNSSGIDLSPDVAQIIKEESRNDENQRYVEKNLSQHVNDLLSQSTQELHLDAGLSDYNLMILKDLAMRLNGIQLWEDKAPEWQESVSDWPASLHDSLLKLSKAFDAETQFQQAWQKKGNTNMEEYRTLFLNQQLQILGTTLYEKIYAEDSMIVDDAGLGASFTSVEDAQYLKSKDHQSRINALDQWKNDKLSDVELRDALGDRLSSEEINQLIDTGLHEAEWLKNIDTFLDEYRFIEQSGIEGEDELLMRQELIDKHFAVENRAIVNQFLFGLHSQP